MLTLQKCKAKKSKQKTFNEKKVWNGSAKYTQDMAILKSSF